MTSASFAPFLSATGGPSEILHSSDGNLSVWNWDSGLGDVVPDTLTTVRWVDARGVHEERFDSESGRLGWVERIGTFECGRGPVYVLVSEDRLDAQRFATVMAAFQAKDGKLAPAAGFFPPGLPGANELRSIIAWEYARKPGVLPGGRPVEVSLDEDAGEIEVRLPGEARFTLECRGGGLVARGLPHATLGSFCGA